MTIMIARDPKGNGWLAAVVALITLFGGPVALERLNTRLIITQDVIICRDSLRRIQQCKRDELDRLVVVHVEVVGPRFPLTRVLMLNRSGRACASLQVDAWSDNQLAEIYHKLGVAVSEHSIGLSPWGANREFPGSTSTLLRYWPAFAVAILLGSFIMIGLVGSFVKT